MKAIVDGFYTTALVNIITWNKAYAIFPEPTFLHHKTYLLTPLDDYYKPLLAKIEARGWPRHEILWEEQKGGVRGSWQGWTNSNQPSRFTVWQRRIGDKRSWIISLPIEQVKQPAMLDTVIEYSEFDVEMGKLDSVSDLYYYIRAPLFTSPVLRYTYTYTQVLNRLGEWLVYLSCSKLSKLKPDERPAGYDDALLEAERIEHSFPEDYEVPEGWTYYDQDLPDWYDFEERKMLARQHASRGGL
jgi:hypothetical protein